MAGLKGEQLNSRKYRTIRLMVLRRDAYICTYCGDRATHVDHVVARVNGGSNNMDNLVASCKRCNLKKGRASVDVFLRAQATPLVSSSNLSLVTRTTVPNGPFDGQPKQDGI